MGTLLGIMNFKATALDTFLKSLQDREINVEDVARIKKLSDVLEVKYANIESTWESLVEPGEDPFKDEKEYDKCRGDYEKASVTLDKHLEAAEDAINRARNEGTATGEGIFNNTSSQLVSNQPQQVFTRPTKMDDMLKPKRKLEDKMNYEQSLQWFIEFRRHITLESNKRFLDAQTPSVRRGILEGCISASFATHLRAKATEETPLDECLGILEKIFLDKNPIWARRKA